MSSEELAAATRAILSSAALDSALLTALSHECASLPRPAGKGLCGDELRLDELVRLASRVQADKDPYDVIDQKNARKLYFVLFRNLELAGLGRLVLGRRGRGTRLRCNAVGELFTAVGNALRDRSDGPKRPPKNLDATGLTETQLPASLRRSVTATADNSRARPRVRDDDIMERLREVRGEIQQRFNVASLAVFGSVARGEPTSASDIDMLVSFEPVVTSDAFFGLKFFLEDLLQRRVDLATEASVSGRLRASIEAELVRVA